MLQHKLFFMATKKKEIHCYNPDLTLGINMHDQFIGIF